MQAASGPPKLVGETKDTGFKRPAKLQRKLDEIKARITVYDGYRTDQITPHRRIPPRRRSRPRSGAYAESFFYWVLYSMHELMRVLLLVNVQVSSDEIKPAEEQTPMYGYGYVYTRDSACVLDSVLKVCLCALGRGYFRGHLEEPVDGEYYPTTIFVGGLSEQTEERDLERAFSRFGPIDAIRLIHNKK